MNRGNSGFGNGVVVGMVMGAILVLLFTTKKGRQILQLLSEEGFEKVKDWEKILSELEFDQSTDVRHAGSKGTKSSGLGFDEDEEGEDYAASVVNKMTHQANGINHAVHRVKPATRRVFRNLSKD